MSEKKIAVAVVEDVAGTRESLVALLGCTVDIQCVGAFATGELALRELPARPAEVVLMDIKLPGMSGVKCVGELKRLLPKQQILMLTTYEDSDLIFDSLRAGASGYLLKNMKPAEIVQAVRDVHSGGSPMSVHIARKVVNYFQAIKPPESVINQLTPRELEVLDLLAKGFLYKEIAERLGISTSTVRGHLHLVYEKLHVQSRTEAVVRFFGR